MIDLFTVEHREHVSTRIFEEVVAALEEATGSVEDGGFADDVREVRNAADFEARTRARIGPSDFTRFLTIDHGSWLPFFGINAKCRTYTIGNPLIARTMLMHDIGAGLNVPLKVMIYEDIESGTTRFAYDLPSSLMSRLGNAEVTLAARALDAKLAGLAELVTGAKA
jgi:hypothetical protein